MQARQRRLNREREGERCLRGYVGNHPRWENARPTEKRASYLDRELAELTKQIEYWQGVYYNLQAAGDASTLGPHNVSKGDWVLLRCGWARVRRVNKKSVTVPNPNFPPARPGTCEETWLVEWHKLRAATRRARDVDPALIEAYEAPGDART